MAISRYTMIISGQVQGVCFRYYAKQKAEELGLKGFVRNAFNGSVETTAEGPKDKLDEYLDWCNEGPPAAHVADVIQREEPVTDEFSSFEISW